MADGSVKIGVDLETDKLKSQIKGLESTVGAIGQKQTAIGKTLTAAVTAPVVAATAYAAKAAIDFESAFAGVRKTVDATESEYKGLSDSIKKMSTEMPTAASELAYIMELAGQLGIRGNDNLEKFTKTIADMSVSTNLSSEAAATMMAQFANITKMSTGDIEKLGSTIVDLGNNFATTEADILSMGMRLAGAGSQVGLSQAQIMGYAAALSSVGIEAEAGGSAFSKIMVKMNLAAETGKDGLGDFAKVAGMTGKQFQTAFKQDAASAIQAFIVGLGKMDEDGTSAIKILDDMGIKEIRLRDALLRASNASDLFAKAQNSANQAWTEGSALATEADKRYATTASRIKILGNEMTAMAMNAGEAYVLPGLEKGMSQAKKWITSLKSMTKEQKATATTAAGIAAALGPGLMVFGKANTAIGGVTEAFKSVASAASSAGGGIAGWGKSLGAMVGPAGYIALAAAGIYGIGKAIEAAEKNVPSFENSFKKAFESLDKGLVSERSERIKKLIDANVEIKTKTTVTEVNLTPEAAFDDAVKPIIDKLETGGTVDAPLAVSVINSVTNLADGFIASAQADAQKQIDALSIKLELGEIDQADYDAKVAAITTNLNNTVDSLNALKSSTTTSVQSMVDNANTTVESAKSSFGGIAAAAKPGIDYLNSIPGLITVGKDSIQTKLDEIWKPLTDQLAAGKTIDSKLAVNVTEATANLIDSAISGVETSAQTEIDKLDVKLSLKEIDKTTYDTQVEAIKTQMTETVTSLESLKNTTASAVESMVDNSNTTVESANAQLNNLKTTATSTFNYLNSIPSLVKVGSLFSEIKTKLTDKKGDTAEQTDWLKAEAEKIFNGEIERVNAYIAGELAKLDINDPNYEAAKANIVAEGEELKDQLMGLQAETTAFVQDMSGKATSTVKANMDELDAIEKRAFAVTQAIHEALDASAKQQSAQVELTKAGKVTDSRVIDQVFVDAFSVSEAAKKDAKDKYDRDMDALFQEYENSTKTEADQANFKAASDALSEKFAQQNSDIEEAYKREIGELLAGITSAYPELASQMAQAADKLDLSAAMQRLAAKAKEGALEAGDIPAEIAEALNMTPEAIAKKINSEANQHYGAAMGGERKGFSTWLEGWISGFDEDAAAITDKMKLGELGIQVASLIEAGITEGIAGLEGLDVENMNAIVFALLGRLGQTDTQLKFPMDAEPDPKLDPASAKKAAEETGEQLSDAIENTDVSPADVTIPVDAHTEAAESDDGTSAIDELVAPIQEAAETESEPVPVTITLAPNVTIAEDAGASATQAGQSIAAAIVNAANAAFANASFGTIGSGITQTLATGISNGANSITTAAIAIMNLASTTFTTMAKSTGFTSAGISICEGVAAGIRSGKYHIVAAINEAASAAKSAFDSAMQINSPAKVMIPSGKSIPEGIAVGIDKGRNFVDKALDKLSDKISTARLTNGAFFDAAAQAVAFDQQNLVPHASFQITGQQQPPIDYEKFADALAGAMPDGSLKLEMDGKVLAETNAPRNAYAIANLQKAIIDGMGG